MATKKKAEKNPVGRPTKYTDEIADSICNEIGTTTHGVHKVADNHNIAASTLMLWLGQHSYFSEQYARAKGLQADLLAAQIIELADKSRLGKKTVDKPTGVEITEGDMVERSRLQIDARKWLAGKLAPSKYGDKIDVTSDNKPLQLSAKVEIVHTKK